MLEMIEPIYFTIGLCSLVVSLIVLDDWLNAQYRLRELRITKMNILEGIPTIYLDDD